MIQEFKLYGLNRKANGKGIYATVEMPNEDWFHSDFDTSFISQERQNALFDYAKGTDNFWSGANIRAVVKFDKFSSGNVPENPIITAIKNIP